ncbi:MAG: hypothetical protein AAFQ87_10760, partial [Bacteroidota bacterium]
MIKEELKIKGLKRSHREAYLYWLFREVEELSYGVLKYFYTSLSEIPAHADLDLVVQRDELHLWKTILASGPGVQKVRFVHKTIGCFAQVYFSNLEYLELDLLTELRWRDLVFLDAKDLLDGVVLNSQDIKTINTADSFAYLLAFYSLNRCPIPQKYQSYFGLLSKKEKITVLRGFGQKFGLENIEVANLFINEWYRDDLETSVRRSRANKGLRRWRHYLKAAWDRYTDVQPTITFSGVDGAGKSTILERTKTLLTEKYRREVVVLRQRPSILPILSSYKYGKEAAEKRAATTLPRQGNNQSRISSLIRFAYYLLDYLLGQAYVYWPINRRGKLLLYDRYYFDYIVDSRRANINLGP